jgi:hypothetical protein
MLLADAISLSLFAVYPGVPVLAWAVSRDFWYMWLVPYVFAFGVLVEYVKTLFPNLRRPAGAHACDLLCRGGNVGGRPGFPSGHVGITTLVLTAVAWRAGILWLWPVAVVWIMAMAWSRKKKQCHDDLQVVGGVIFGGIAAACTTVV